MKLILLFLALFVLLGCDNRAGMWGDESLPPLSGPPDTNIPTDPRPTNPPDTTVPATALDANVPWALYGEEGLRTTLAGLALSGDCVGLRRQFVQVYERGDVKDVALLEYIDKLLEIVGCTD